MLQLTEYVRLYSERRIRIRTTMEKIMFCHYLDVPSLSWHFYHLCVLTAFKRKSNLPLPSRVRMGFRSTNYMFSYAYLELHSKFFTTYRFLISPLSFPFSLFNFIYLLSLLPSNTYQLLFFYASLPYLLLFTLHYTRWLFVFTPLTPSSYCNILLLYLFFLNVSSLLFCFLLLYSSPRIFPLCLLLV